MNTASDHRTFNLQTIAALRSVQVKSQPIYDEIQMLAERIELCSHPDNHWFAERPSMFIDEPVTIRGQFWRCHSKLCSFCTRTQSRTTRRRLVAALICQDLPAHERYTFATLTIVNPSQPLNVTRQLVYDTWKLFRQRPFWRSLLVGGCKSEEFTLTSTGVHYHLHLLIRSSWFNYQDFKREWTAAYRAAEQKHGLEASFINNADGYLRCDFRTVSDLNRVSFELCKYITKSDSWMKLRDTDLIELALVRRWHRSFELLGSFRETSTYVHNRRLNVQDEAEATLYPDAPPVRYWRDRLHANGFDHEICVLTMRWDRAIDYGRRKLDKTPDLAHASYGFPSTESLQNNQV